MAMVLLPPAEEEYLDYACTGTRGEAPHTYGGGIVFTVHCRRDEQGANLKAKAKK